MQPPTPSTNGMAKRELYQQLCEQLQVLLGAERDLTANAANAASLLFHSLPDVNWAGFYFTQGEELVLGPFQGKPACVRIPLGKGVCGTAADAGETVVVPDVHDFPGHIACDAASRSEVVVPLMSWGMVVGVLDVDSASFNRFDEDDVEGLESFAAVFLGASHSSEWPDLTAEADLHEIS